MISGKLFRRIWLRFDVGRDMVDFPSLFIFDDLWTLTFLLYIYIV